MAWEKYETTLAGKCAAPFISYRERGGYFNFNAACVKKYGLGKFQFCDLYYDKTTSRIGFQFLVKYQPGAHRFISYKRTQLKAVVGKKFIRANHLTKKMDNQRFFEIKLWNKQADFLYVCIK